MTFAQQKGATISSSSPTISDLSEEQLQELSNVLTHLVFRNGVVEDLHSRQAPLTDETMRALNIDVNNRIYTILCLVHDHPDVCMRFAEDAKRIAPISYDASWNDAEPIRL